MIEEDERTNRFIAFGRNGAADFETVAFQGTEGGVAAGDRAVFMGGQGRHGHNLLKELRRPVPLLSNFYALCAVLKIRIMLNELFG